MSTKTEAAYVYETDSSYAELERKVRENIAKAEGPFFRTSVDPETLWQSYINSIPEAFRQHYTCNACRHFIQRFSGLVTVDADGRSRSVVWGNSSEFPTFFAEATTRLRKAVEQSRITGVALWDGKGEWTWGTPKTGEWTHLSGVCTCKASVATRVLKETHELEAEKREDFKVLKRSLADFSVETAAAALRILEGGQLYRSEKAQAVAKWFHELHMQQAAAAADRLLAKENLIWRAVMAAPVGFTHVRTAMVGTLLEDLKEGLDLEVVKRKWAEKLHPLQYQRPTAAPKEGQIDHAEKVVEAMGVASAFKRRAAKLTDVLKKLFPNPDLRPTEPEAPAGGVFGDLRKKKPASAPVELAEVAMSWTKFARDVLPNVTSLELKVPHGNSHFYSLVAAADPEAQPILQWDGLEGHPRNTVNWYFYHGGSRPTDYNVSSGWRKVNAVFLPPHTWQEPEKFKHQQVFAMFALEGAYDVKRSAGLALFPEIIKAGLHEIRSVLEAHSKKGRIEDVPSGDANGLALQRDDADGVLEPFHLRVVTMYGKASYKLDRWE